MTKEQAYRVLAVYASSVALHEFYHDVIVDAGFTRKTAEGINKELDILEAEFGLGGDDAFPIPEALVVVFGGGDGPVAS